ncbi:MAG: VanZ family protein [Microbacterium sp.]
MEADQSPLPAEWFAEVPPRPALPHSARRGPWVRRLRNPHGWLWGYGVALALIALWPQPVDRGASRLLKAVTHVIPLLTYARIEFIANIALFVPFGLLLALILSQRWLVLPIAFVTTVLIEGIQAVILDERTPSLYDIVANLAGACVGLLLVELVSWRRRRK